MAGSDVRTFHRDTRAHDNHQIARARVDLKLAALAYGSSRHGFDASQKLVSSGLRLLCNAAVRYASALLGQQIASGANPDEQAALDLGLAALAYGESRHGSDGGVSMARAGMGMLCQAAVRFVEGLTGRPVPVDTTLHLDDGM